MQVLEFQTIGRARKEGILGRSTRVIESAKVVLDSPVFPEVVEAGGKRTLRTDGALYQEMNKGIERVGGHPIEVSSAKSETEITVEYLVKYEF